MSRLELLNLALKVLSSRYDDSRKVTESKLEALKAYLPGDVIRMSNKDIASAVVEREFSIRKQRRSSGGEAGRARLLIRGLLR
jgi:hypothetical protein